MEPIKLMKKGNKIEQNNPKFSEFWNNNKLGEY